MKHVAFMRNVMVGRNGLTQKAVIAAFEQVGASQVTSFLVTGNIVFATEEQNAAATVTRAAEFLLAHLGLKEPMFTRSLLYLANLAMSNPFAMAPTDNIYEQCITFLPDGFPGLIDLPVQSTRHDVEIFALVDKEAFSVTRMIEGRSGYAGALIERQTKVQVTTRNWTTISRLLDKYI